MGDDSELLAEQVRYYRERAGEYDDWWYRRGRYDRGPEQNAAWEADVSALEARIDSLGLTGDVLELACGTGLWTQRLVRTAGSLTAVDAAPEVLALNRERIGDAGVEYRQADLFAWEPPRAAFDVCFFSFWLSHVPPERFAAFWSRVAGALRPGGCAVLIDSGPDPTAVARDASADRTLRRLADGREFRIIKRYHEPAALEAELAGLGWSARAEETPGGLFLLGQAVRAA